MKLHLIDGSGFIFRAFFSLPPMARPSDGMRCEAVHGYCTMLWNMCRNHGATDGPSHIAVVFDAPGRNFRHETYSAYKAHRPPKPESMVPQLPLMRDATRAFNLAATELPGYEADDLIATYARLGAEAGMEVVIVSADKDLMQLVGGPITMLRPSYAKDKPPGMERVTEAEVIAKFGVPPERVIDVLALMGDASDNIPGVPTIGAKTAAKLIQEFGDLDNLLENVHEIQSDAIRNAFLWPARRDGKRWLPDPNAEGPTGVEKAIMSRALVRLEGNVPVEAPVDAFERRAIETGTLGEFLDLMEFKTMKEEFCGMLEAA